MTAAEEIKTYETVARSCILFSNLTDEEFGNSLDVLRAQYSVYGKGEMIHAPYLEMKKFGLVLSGTAQACTDDINGNKIIMTEIVPGVTFGESLCFLEIKDSPVYVFASERCCVLWLSAENLFNGCSDKLTVILRKQFTAMLAARTLSMNSRIQVMSKIKLRDKLMSYFFSLSLKTKSKTFTIPMNREDLAAYIGSDRSALSRELSSMKKDGVINIKGKTVKIIL